MYREVACWPLETPSEKHRLSGSKTPTKKGHLTKTHFTPSGTHERSVRPTRRQRPHVHSAQRQFRFLCCCLADCKTRCSSLSRQTSQSNHIIHHIFRSLGFQNKMLGWVITETETNYEDKFHSVKIRWFLSPPVVEFRGAGSSPLPVAPDQNFISKTAWSLSGCTSTLTLRCCAQNSVLDKVMSSEPFDPRDGSVCFCSCSRGSIDTEVRASDDKVFVLFFKTLQLVT